MKIVKEYLFVAFISGLIGMLVALPFTWLFDFGIPGYLVRSYLVGFCIGLLTKLVLSYSLRNVRKNTFLSFAVLLATIFVCTASAAFVMGLRNLLFAVLMALIADMAGMAANWLIYRYAKKMNYKLSEVQIRIKNSQSR